MKQTWQNIYKGPVYDTKGRKNEVGIFFETTFRFNLRDHLGEPGHILSRDIFFKPVPSGFTI